MKTEPHSPTAHQQARAGLVLAAAAGLALADGVPPLVYETFLPGYRLSRGVDVAVDTDGNAFILAANHNEDTRNDIILAKIDPEGGVVWERYLRGSQIDIAGGIALDANGDMWVTGWTDSPDFPITADAIDNTLTGFRDVFVTKLASADGAVLYSTYIGGDYVDGGNDIAIGDDGRVYVTGFSISTDYPVTDDAVQPTRTNGYSYAFSDNILTILSPDGAQILYGTYYGGSEDEEAEAIALDADGSIVIAAWTQSDDYPTLNPFQSAYAGGERDLVVTRFAPGGTAVEFSTYLGGEDWEFLGRIDIAPDGGILIGGSTRSLTYPTTPGAFQTDFAGGPRGCGGGAFEEFYNCENAFVTKLSPDGSTADFSTYIGGDRPDFSRGLAVDNLGRAHIVGYSYSEDYPGGPVEPGSIIVSRLSTDGSAVDYTYSAYSQYANAGHGIAVGDDGGVYLTGAIHFPAEIYAAKLAGECTADFNNDGLIDTQDVLAFLDAWSAGDGSADINVDGTINTIDVLAFLNLWRTGC